VAVRRRIIRLLRRHDIDLEGRPDDGGGDPLALESPVLAHLCPQLESEWKTGNRKPATGAACSARLDCLPKRDVPHPPVLIASRYGRIQRRAGCSKPLPGTSRSQCASMWAGDPSTQNDFRREFPQTMACGWDS
jgi:hypothetical protein